MKRICILICAVVLLMSGCSQTAQQETNEISSTEDVTVLGTTKELTIEETIEAFVTEGTAATETTPSSPEKGSLTEEEQIQLLLQESQCLLLNTTMQVSAEDEIDILKEQFLTNNIAIEECNYSVEDNVLSVTMASDTTGNVINSNDITTLRKSRNTMRYNLNTLRIVSSTATYNEVLKNSVGETLIDSDLNITTLPQFAECSKLLKNICIENTDMSLQNTLYSVSTDQISTEYNYDTSTGNTLIISLDYNDNDYESINKDVANIMHTIDKYNKSNYSVQQVTVNVTNNGNQIIYMEADLVYRDFLWWQLPEMVDRWTLY